MSLVSRSPLCFRALLVLSLAPALSLAAGCGSDSVETPPANVETPDAGEEASTPEADTPEADTPEATPDAEPEGAKVGDACWTDADCESPAVCWSADGEGLPGGYCILEGCTADSCPDGSACFEFNDGAMRCLATCESDGDCRVSEGYVCDTEKTCWPGAGTVPPGGSCGADDQCMGGANAVCITQAGWVGGYCVIAGCTSTSCPEGSECRAVFTDGGSGCVDLCDEGVCRDGYVCVDSLSSKWDGACRAGCETEESCPGDYGCRDELCVDISNECGALNPTGDCPSGNVCNNGVCEPFSCDDALMEPNETLQAAQELPDTSTPGLQICDGDHDWFRFTPNTADTLYLVGIDSNYASGDLQVDMTDAQGAIRNDASASPAEYHEENPVGPTNLQLHSLVGGAGAEETWLHVYGKGGDVNNYGLHTRLVPWQDGPNCAALFDPAECAAHSATGKLDPSKLVIFPLGHAADPFVGDGIFVKNGLSAFGNPPYTTTSRLWAKRELVMILRNALHEVQAAFPGTAPLSIGDVSMSDGTTPDGHPNGTHYEGSNIDFSYFIRPDVLGTAGNLVYRQICCDAALNDWDCVDTSTSSAGYGTCKAGNEHIVDVERTAMMIAKIAGSGRLRVIGVEARIEADIDAAFDTLVTGGQITTAERSAAKSRMATANDDSSWIWHFNHMHASFQTNEPTAASNAAAPSTSFEGPWLGLPREEQAARARAFRPAEMPSE